MAKSANGTSTVSIFSGSQLIAEYDNGVSPDSPSREYVYGGLGLLAMISGGDTTYYHQDHLSVRLTTDANGNVLSQQGSFPFGESWYQSGSGNNFVFTSYEHDSESGLDYALARYYNSRTGSFLMVDPVEGSPGDPQSWNRYPYGRNNPINLTDPSGQHWWNWLLAGIGVAAAIFTPEIDDYLAGTWLGGGASSGAIAFANVADATATGATGAAFGEGVAYGGMAAADDSSMGSLAYNAPAASSSAGTSSPMFQINLYFNGSPQASGAQSASGNAPSIWSRINKVAQCGSRTANQFSIAGVLGINEETNPIGATLSNAFLGNTFSGISDTITHVATGHFGAAYADFALGGTAQGLPSGRSMRPKELQVLPQRRSRRRDGYACGMGEACY